MFVLAIDDAIVLVLNTKINRIKEKNQQPEREAKDRADTHSYERRADCR